MSEIIAKAESQHIIVIGVKLFFARLLLPQDRYNKFLYNQIAKVDIDALPYYSGMLVDCIKLTKKKSQNFRNSDGEAGVIVSQCNLLRPFYRDVYVVVKKHRIKYGLNV